METVNKNKYEIVLRLCATLSFVSMIVTIALALSVHNIRHENNHLASFITKSATLQPDFEQSLVMYTENTEAAMDFVDTLRPDNEAEYINFIGEVESLGRDLGLNVSLESLEATKEVISFSASFYGSKNKVIEFISGLENLPYYIRIEKLSFLDLSLSPATKDDTPTSNVQLSFLLYVK